MGLSPPAVPRSTRCGSRKATASGASTCTPSTTRTKRGSGWAVKLKKGDFVGRDALLAKREQGLDRVLSCMKLAEPGAVVMGKEPIWAGGDVVGYVTSAGYGFSVGCGIAYGYLPAAIASEGTSIEIEYFDRCLKATVSSDPLFDPEGRRLRC